MAFSGALAPGPLMLTDIRESFEKKSAKPGLLLSIGHAVSEAPVILLLAYGLLGASGNMLPFLSISGGTVLVVMGILSLLKRNRAVYSSKPTCANGFLKLVSLGTVISVSNPYWTMWWITIGAAYVSRSLAWSLPGVLLFYISHEAGDFLVLGLISKIAANGSRMLGDRRLKILTILCNSALILIGLWFLIDGVRALAGL
ncbi:MAG: LysE family transporter [Thermoproteota archaeon]